VIFRVWFFFCTAFFYFYFKIPQFLWCPTELVLANGEKLVFPIENCEKVETNFYNSVGLRYQAEAARVAINNGKYIKDLIHFICCSFFIGLFKIGFKEHDYVQHDHSRLIMKIMDEARRQVGYN
jgi:hypothetical protein